MKGRDYYILLVDNDPGHVRVAGEVFRGGQKLFYYAADGLEAMACLRSRDRLPDLILLNMNMRGEQGNLLLAELKADETLRRIPVVALSASETAREVCQAYDLLANCYVTKPADPNDFRRVLLVLEEFWFGVAKLPGA